jgi:hypothetical protein
MVHQGFHRAYTANGFNDKLLSRLEHILYRCASQQKSAGGDRPVNVFVTGWGWRGGAGEAAELEAWRQAVCGCGQPCLALLPGPLTPQALAGRRAGHAVRLRHQEALPLRRWCALPAAPSACPVLSSVQLCCRWL